MVRSTPYGGAANAPYALVDRLQAGTLTPAQVEAVRALGTGLLLLAEQQAAVAQVPEPVA